MASFSGDQDFIRFEDEDLGTSRDHAVAFENAPVAQGQPQLVTRGVKRSADEMSDMPKDDPQSLQRAAEALRLAPWAELVDWGRCHNAAEMLHEEIKAFVVYMSPKPEEHQTRLMIIEWIQETICRAIPSATVTCFGSFQTQLYLPDADIDLVVSSPHVTASSNTLRRIAALLKNAGIAKNTQIIASAKVPIIKFTTGLGSFAVDISINQENGIQTGNLVNHLVLEHAALRPLVLLVKTYLRQRKLNEVFTGGLGSYAIVCLVVNFLQMHPKIRFGEIDPSENFGVLLLEFFETYGVYFNYKTTGISILDGGHYFHKWDHPWRDNRAQGAPLAIEDPTDRGNNISASSHQFYSVKSNLAGAFSILSASLCLRGQELDAKRKGSYHLLSDGVDRRSAGEKSLLGSFISMTQTTMTHRAQVLNLYFSGALHRILNLEPPELADADEFLAQDMVRMKKILATPPPPPPRPSQRRHERSNGKKRRESAKDDHRRGKHTRYPKSPRSPSPRRSHQRPSGYEEYTVDSDSDASSRAGPSSSRKVGRARSPLPLSSASAPKNPPTVHHRSRDHNRYDPLEVEERSTRKYDSARRSASPKSSRQDARSPRSNRPRDDEPLEMWLEADAGARERFDEREDEEEEQGRYGLVSSSAKTRRSVQPKEEGETDSSDSDASNAPTPLAPPSLSIKGAGVKKATSDKIARDKKRAYWIAKAGAEASS